VGDACQLFGPRRSLDTSAEGAVTLIGDETGFGLGASLRGKARLVFEVNNPAECQPVLDRLGLVAKLVRRAPDDAHLAEIEAELGGDGLFLLTGRAQAIQRIGRTLKAAGVPAAQIRSKAYWAPGKTGMD
jgi:ferric-chelate reductase (NADPH)